MLFIRTLKLWRSDSFSSWSSVRISESWQCNAWQFCTHTQSPFDCVSMRAIASVSLVPYKQMRTPNSQHAFCSLFILGWVTATDTNYRGGSERKRCLRDRRQGLMESQRGEEGDGWRVNQEKRGLKGENWLTGSLLSYCRFFCGCSLSSRNVTWLQEALK